ncbi:hypothetical protein GGTG_04129 [Gaeumannomyces tritici R3-111a-1]|uniref:Uncharacterized protein n=1 Tax=Gaeumannomyces tritici (strain R3-111a-1) TaxID=644352 RepID=J3NS84_GAET3|nr:hypothetical protein GGTG_04129 [Gaeumannomyces tritici R3-111a-1]EJT79040.1 hypothetical protein GGTG_04129 [Gaeumannomyces tritici R3-111a-1]
MGWALLKPWNLALVAAAVVLSGPLTVAAICTSFLSATLLVFLSGAILIHAAVASVCRVFFWPRASPPPAPSAAAPSVSTRGGGGSHARSLSSDAAAPRQPSPLLVIQGSGRSRASRGNSLSQRVTLPAANNADGSPSSTRSSSCSASSSAGSSYANGFPFGGSDNGGSASGHRQGMFGFGAGQASSAGGAASNRRRHSLIPPAGGPLDGNEGDTGDFYDDYDDGDEGSDGYCYYPDEIEHGGGGGGSWPSDFAPQLSLPSRLFHQGGGGGGDDVNPKIRLFQQQQQQQQYRYNHPQQLQLLTMLRSGGGQALPMSPNSSRRRASIGGVPSLLRAGGAGAGFGGGSAPTAAYATSRSGSSTPWKRARQTSEFGL